MNPQNQLGSQFTESEYWQLEAETPIKHEFLRGRTVAMVQVSSVHVTIMGNVGTTLHGQLRGRPCRVAMSQQRLKIAAADIQTYPDVVVSCPAFQTDPNHRDTLTDATVIVEVLSPSSEEFDRNAKFDAYKQLPSLRHYLLIAQTPYEVEHHFLDGKTWRSETFTDAADIVRLVAIDCQLTLDEIYEDVELSD